jgi:hypothetical protein
MLNGKTVSIDFIIEQLYRDYSFNDLNRAEIAEWLWMSIGIIGTPAPFEDKKATLELEQFRAVLPVDLYKVEMVREKSTGITLREMSDVFFKFNNTEFVDTTTVIADYDPASNSRSHYDVVVGPNSSSNYFTFKLQGNYIYSGMDTGTIEIAYKAFPVDIITGLPVIPDNARYIRGVVGYLAERLAFRMMLKDQLSERKYDIIKTDYLFNVGAAKAECIMPDVSRMETMLNRFKSGYDGPNHFDTGFKWSGSRE